jgi:nitrite reductase/ring-hydroxylating ferredoxin subunit
VTRHVVARAADLMPGTRKLVTVEGRGIVVLNIKGELFALSNTCPHKGASLCNGLLTGLVRSTKPGEYQYERAGEILRCPWHQWEFDVRTGPAPASSKARTSRRLSRSRSRMTTSSWMCRSYLCRGRVRLRLHAPRGCLMGCRFHLAAFGRHK